MDEDKFNFYIQVLIQRSPLVKSKGLPHNENHNTVVLNK